jgi:N-acetylglucosaminyl-diphospho-decaprenol L-rhamnosyltransferase
MHSNDFSRRNMAQGGIGNQARVTAVIVTYRSALTAPATLAEIRQCVEAGLLECVLVDNGSKDGTPELLRRQSDWAQVVLGAENIGFGRGCNVGLAKVETPFTLFLNPDASIDRSAVQSLLAFMEGNPQAGACGPATLVGGGATTQRFQVAGRRMGPLDVVKTLLPPRWAPHDLHVPIEPGGAPHLAGWVCGAVMMVRTDVLKKLGGFDPRFFLYWEETDVCKRLEDSGYGVWVVPGALARHLGGASSGQDETRIAGCIAKHYYQSRRHYLIKHHGWPIATLAEAVEFGLLCMLTATDVLRGRGRSRLVPRLQTPLFSSPPKEEAL